MLVIMVLGSSFFFSFCGNSIPLLYCVFSVDVDALADDNSINGPSFLVSSVICFGYRIYFFDYMCLLSV